MNKAQQFASGYGKPTRERAYAAGARIAREKMRREAPLDAAALEQIEASDIVVVPGSYDQVELVLNALEMPHTRVDAAALSSVTLRPEQLLVINCPGDIGARDIEKVRAFVEQGGSLFTTDWALRNVIERAFPGVLAYNDRPTADDVVRIEVCSGDNPFLHGVMDGADDPQWWLEGSSYPIKIVEQGRVRVLIRSRELGEKYGEEPVAVQFKAGYGEVFHMISHYYLQRTELRDARHAAPAAAYAEEKGVADGADLTGLNVAEVESAHASARLFANIASSKKRRG